jgi:alpha-D-ribose 1-methylphosphonate 5-triphosphate synthase subunit PhnH
MNMPIFTETEAQTRLTFLPLMWALSHPGRIYELSLGTETAVSNMALIGQTLLDLETSFFTSDEYLAEELTRTTAVPAPPAEAFYHFYPALVRTDLEMLSQARLGDMMYPDRSATLLLGCRLGTGDTFYFTGPGIEDKTAVNIAFVPPEFWGLREQANQYPLGWDVFLIDGNRIVGLPRTTKVWLAEPVTKS